MYQYSVDIQLALRRLFELRRANIDALRAMHDEGPDTLAGLIADLVANMAVLAARISPYLTGTLSSSHRGELIEVTPEHVVGLIYIDPSVVNPVFGGFPAVYGIEVHQRKPWLDWTIEYGEYLLTTLEQNITATITGPFKE